MKNVGSMKLNYESGFDFFLCTPASNASGGEGSINNCEMDVNGYWFILKNSL